MTEFIAYTGLALLIGLIGWYACRDVRAMARETRVPSLTPI